MRRLVVVVVVALVLAGCGGSSDPSERAFVDEANRICREGEAKVSEIVREAPRTGDPEEVAADTLRRASEAYEPLLARLRDLDAPDDLRDDWSQFLDGIDEAFALFPRLAEATRTEDREELIALSERFDEIAGETRPFAEQHNLDDCLPENGRL
jgi:hypothetical protein